ncbi:MAG: phosphatase PAP2 family protein [Prevotellaceae bacterium]|jgi:membrane-associated phospholipid phosphatase|nr:phosphatase PAP2 family protein [Prevotellaceae bacterium]
MLQIKKCYPVEQITVFYVLLTAVYMLALPGTAGDMLLPLLSVRLLVLAALFLLQWTDTARTPAMTLIRQLLPLLLVLYWYPETYYIGSCFFPNLDGFLTHADELLFGGQGSLAFCRIMPWPWFNELMNFAYLSFYFIIILTVAAIYKTAKTAAGKAIFVLLFSFLSYYLLFIIFPAAGPQFYFPEPDNCTPDTWPFRAIMQFLQGCGEKPTGAFPSSHVGITVVCMLLLRAQKMRKLFWSLLPLALLLIASTVYIKAHYVVDVPAGLLTAPLLYKTGCYIWNKRNK